MTQIKSYCYTLLVLVMWNENSYICCTYYIPKWKLIYWEIVTFAFIYETAMIVVNTRYKKYCFYFDICHTLLTAFIEFVYAYSIYGNIIQVKTRLV